MSAPSSSNGQAFFSGPAVDAKSYPSKKDARSDLQAKLDKKRFQYPRLANRLSSSIWAFTWMLVDRFVDEGLVTIEERPPAKSAAVGALSDDHAITASSTEASSSKIEAAPFSFGRPAKSTSSSNSEAAPFSLGHGIASAKEAPPPVIAAVGASTTEPPHSESAEKSPFDKYTLTKVLERHRSSIPKRSTFPTGTTEAPSSSASRSTLAFPEVGSAPWQETKLAGTVPMEANEDYPWYDDPLFDFDAFQQTVGQSSTIDPAAAAGPVSHEQNVANPSKKASPSEERSCTVLLWPSSHSTKPLEERSCTVLHWPSGQGTKPLVRSSTHYLSTWVQEVQPITGADGIQFATASTTGANEPPFGHGHQSNADTAVVAQAAEASARQIFSNLARPRRSAAKKSMIATKSQLDDKDESEDEPPLSEQKTLVHGDENFIFMYFEYDRLTGTRVPRHMIAERSTGYCSAEHIWRLHDGGARPEHQQAIIDEFPAARLLSCKADVKYYAIPVDSAIALATRLGIFKMCERFFQAVTHRPAVDKPIRCGSCQTLWDRERKTFKAWLDHVRHRHHQKE
ncbi:hypothetical protein IWZ00DRAFT_543290 [Phyllosticta capitalensis]